MHLVKRATVISKNFTQVARYSTTTGTQQRISPSARNLLFLNQLDASKVSGSGRHGMIMKGDVINFLAGTPSTTPQAAAPTPTPKPTKPTTAKITTSQLFDAISLEETQRIWANQVSEGKRSIPHGYMTSTVNLQSSTKLTPTLIAKATASAIQRFPVLNSHWDANAQEGVSSAQIKVLLLQSSSSPAVLTDPHSVDVAAVEKQIAQKDNSISSTCSLTVGSNGLSSVVPVILPNHGASIAISSGSPSIVLNVNDEPTIATPVSLSLSFDQRVIDPSEAAAFLEELKTLLSFVDAL